MLTTEKQKASKCCQKQSTGILKVQFMCRLFCYLMEKKHTRKKRYEMSNWSKSNRIFKFIILL